MAYYVGLDVGLRSSSICIIDDQGAVRLERDAPSEIEEIAACIRSVAGEIEGLALETGNLTPWLTAGLRAEWFRVVVMEARQVKTTLSNMVVTGAIFQRRDAEVGSLLITHLWPDSGEIDEMQRRADAEQERRHGNG